LINVTKYAPITKMTHQANKSTKLFSINFTYCIIKIFSCDWWLPGFKRVNLVYDFLSIDMRHSFFNTSFDFAQIYNDFLNGNCQGLLKFFQNTIKILFQMLKREFELFFINQCPVIRDSFFNRCWRFIECKRIKKILFPINRVDIWIDFWSFLMFIKSKNSFRLLILIVFLFVFLF